MVHLATLVEDRAVSSSDRARIKGFLKKGLVNYSHACVCVCVCVRACVQMAGNVTRPHNCSALLLTSARTTSACTYICTYLTHVHITMRTQDNLYLKHSGQVSCVAPAAHMFAQNHVAPIAHIAIIMIGWVWELFEGGYYFFQQRHSCGYYSRRATHR